MLRAALLTILLLAMTISYPSPAFACSGGPPAWDEYLPYLVEHSEVIVIGRYAEVDDAGANGIFRVESYLKGFGAEHLLISTEDPLYTVNEQTAHRYYYRCWLFPNPMLDQTYVYFLNHQQHGGYTIRDVQVFPTAESTIDVYYNTPNRTSIIVQPLTQTDLHQQISEEVGHEPQSPSVNLPYPRTTPILITTTVGESFLLPVDTSRLVRVTDDQIPDLQRDQYECRTPFCAVYSPNGLDKIFLVPSGSEIPEPLIDEYRTEPFMVSFTYGHRISVSSTSDSYVLWHDDQISIHGLWYPELGYATEPMPQINQLRTIPAETSINYPVAWSPDGRMLALSTDSGLYLWDALTTGDPPRLLLRPNPDVPVARYFSPGGRYLAVTEGERRYTLDLVSMRELPDGLVSPDDRTLLVFDTASDTPVTLEIALLTPGYRQVKYNTAAEYSQLLWVNNTQFTAVIQGFGYLSSKHDDPYVDPRDGMTYVNVTQYWIPEPFYDVIQHTSPFIPPPQLPYSQAHDHIPYEVDFQALAYDFESDVGLVEVSADGYTLSINNQLLSLENYLPAPIASVEWLPSLFYYENP